MKPIRPHDPLAPDSPLVGVQSLPVERPHHYPPERPDTCRPRSIYQGLVQDRSANSHTRINREPSFCSFIRIDVANPSNRHLCPTFHGDTEAAQSPHTIRHQALATRLVDGGMCSVHHEHIVSQRPELDGRGQSHGTASDNHNLRFSQHHAVLAVGSGPTRNVPGPAESARR